MKRRNLKRSISDRAQAVVSLQQDAESDPKTPKLFGPQKPTNNNEP